MRWSNDNDSTPRHAHTQLPGLAMHQNLVCFFWTKNLNFTQKRCLKESKITYKFDCIPVTWMNWKKNKNKFWNPMRWVSVSFPEKIGTIWIANSSPQLTQERLPCQTHVPKVSGKWMDGNLLQPMFFSLWSFQKPKMWGELYIYIYNGKNSGNLRWPWNLVRRFSLTLQGTITYPTEREKEHGCFQK